MPMVTFRCNNEDCENHIDKFFSSHKDIPDELDCGACGIGKLERELGAPASKSTQFIDNGMQSRRVEVSSEVVEKERKRLYTKGD